MAQLPRIPMKGAGGYAAKRQEIRMAKAATTTGSASKAQMRAIQAKQRLEEGRRMDAAESVLRRGAVEHPPKGGISKELERRRTEVAERGTSIARMKRHGNEEAPEIDEESEADIHSDDIQKLELAKLPSELKNPKLLQRKFRTGI